LENLKNYRIAEITAKLDKAQFYPLDVMISGVTGAGKSSTLNALFQQEIARVGMGVDPETMSVNAYFMNERIRLWDTPGLGDGIEQDKRHGKQIIDLLAKTYHLNNMNFGFIDLALIVLDGGGRDMGTTYELLNQLILPNISPDRVMVVINQADVAMKGRHWNTEHNQPEALLRDFLSEKAQSIQMRVKEATGLQIMRPVFYSAQNHYNIRSFYDFIIDHIPTERRCMDVSSIRPGLWSRLSA
jgi:predicted GTPase